MRSSHFLLSTAGVRYALALCLPVALLPLTGCGEKQDSKATAAAAAAALARPREVGVLTIHPVSVPLQRELPGYVKPVRVAQVRARVAGILLKQVFREGSDVKEGDLLFQIDPALFDARVESAKATVKQAEAGIARAEANLNNTSLIVKRYSELIGTQAVSQQDLDNAVAAELQARAELQGAKASLLAANATLKAAELDLGYTKVTAPISGRIGRPLVTEGALVGQGEATPLAEINQLDPVYVDFTQPASELSTFKQQAGTGTDWSKVKVSLLLDGTTEYKHPGKLLFSEISVDTSTSSVTLRTEFPNPDWLLWPGVYTRGRFEFDDDSKVFLIPQQAVLRSANGAAVYVVGSDNKVALVPLKSNEARNTNWIVREGLNDGDRVIVEGGQKIMPLFPGATVIPVPWNPATEAPKK
ncbi:MAG: efflux RND transporter periplasmic adaptor subunit [Puniceicoccales bacterium]|jgi:membrane fusion protein (multidrug efflux system)|nr:efflux RND transporter periplasmic adaptor subunit [Puniceicoccales bacterium]